MRLSNVCQTSRLPNMVWVPPPCAHPERGSGVLLWRPFFKLMRGERIQIPLKMGDHRRASETHLILCMGLSFHVDAKADPRHHC